MLKNLHKTSDNSCSFSFTRTQSTKSSPGFARYLKSWDWCCCDSDIINYQPKLCAKRDECRWSADDEDVEMEVKVAVEKDATLPVLRLELELGLKKKKKKEKIYMRSRLRNLCSPKEKPRHKTRGTFFRLSAIACQTEKGSTAPKKKPKKNQNLKLKKAKLC